MSEQNEGRTETQRPATPTAKGPSLGERIASGIDKMTEPKVTVGIPFHWALAFGIVLLGAIFLGHYLTVQGQDRYLQREKSPHGQASTGNSNSPQNQEITETLKKLLEQNKNKKDQQTTNTGDSSSNAAATQKISESMLSVSENMTSIADKLANNGRTFEQNLKTVRDNLEILTQTLKDDTSKRDIMDKLELAMNAKGNIDTTALAKATDFQSLSAKIDAQVAAKNDIEAMRKDLSGLSTKVQDLTALIKSKESVPGLGEEFAPKR